MNPIALPILSRIPLGCHSRESGSPERIEKTGFLLSQERRIELENDFFRKMLNDEPLAKLLKARRSRHPGQAKRDPESSIFEQFWILALAPDPIRGSPE